jgi:hypothetical protein
VVIVIILVLYTSYRLARRLFGSEKYPNWGTVIAIILAILDFFYFQLALATLGVFDCTISGDHWVVSKEPSLVCDAKDLAYSTIKNYGMVSAVVYVLGIPCLLFVLLFRSRREIIADQTAACDAVSMSNPTSPVVVSSPFSPKAAKENAPFCKVAYGSLYEAYKPKFYYWKVVENLRKLILSSIIIIFSEEDPVFQVMHRFIMDILPFSWYRPVSSRVF